VSGRANVLALDSSSRDWRVNGAHARHLLDQLSLGPPAAHQDLCANEEGREGVTSRPSLLTFL
jgi:hypothetical protein